MQATATNPVLHSDNGGAMKGATMLAKMQQLGVVASFSRPGVSDDNPYSEALFKTLKYRAWYPDKGFDGLASARQWVTGFVQWYNDVHYHSGIGYVTPQQRYSGADIKILNNRRAVYEQAKAQNPQRWSGQTRAWDHPAEVILNPDGKAEMKTPAKTARRSQTPAASRPPQRGVLATPPLTDPSLSSRPASNFADWPQPLSEHSQPLDLPSFAS